MHALPEGDEQWERLRQGEESALFSIYQQYYNQLYKYGLRVTGDASLVADHINQVFMELWEHHGSLKEVRNVKGYLLTYLKRKIFRDQEQRRRHDLFLKEQVNEDLSFQLSVEEHMIQLQLREDQRRQLLAAVNNLSLRQRELIRLRYFDELSYEEIARKTRLSTRTVYNNISLAIHALKKALLIGLLI
ncbi:sigma-70 family RNA polymerase sigma factor [Chitinophaga pendula]|uniref:RNA polymerase sigma factor n=1 Tax=Chitinophaga TaxID=79328 RepID=UPI000BAFFFB9|nr:MULTISPECIES: sigma-70 family RNA polymerase sigma factor [Chitinophaga]ASZ10658.1 hypothetical protein CK934_06530 [Chitinophaga sp. MD30]UCJ06366.1 sigma-70 family RNA polymerase sigma factor [Chitinophaga pendula]